MKVVNKNICAFFYYYYLLLFCELCFRFNVKAQNKIQNNCNIFYCIVFLKCYITAWVICMFILSHQSRKKNNRSKTNQHPSPSRTTNHPVAKQATYLHTSICTYIFLNTKKNWYTNTCKCVLAIWRFIVLYVCMWKSGMGMSEWQAGWWFFVSSLLTNHHKHYNLAPAHSLTFLFAVLYCYSLFLINIHFVTQVLTKCLNVCIVYLFRVFFFFNKIKHFVRQNITSWR